MLTVAVFQPEARACDPAGQIAVLDAAAGEAAQGGAALVVCPELFVSGYAIGEEAVRAQAEPADGPSCRAIAALAEKHGLAILYGYPERDGGCVYNSARCVGPGGEAIANHRKLHLSGSYEKNAFATGERLTLFDIAGLRVAVLICYDVEFPEAVRAAARNGAELVAVPTALRPRYARLARTMMPTRAFENGVFLAYANHCGRDTQWRYCGLSCVVGPDGRDLARAGRDPGLITATLDRDAIARARAELPYLDDARSDLKP